MDWIALISAAMGATVALTATVLAHLLRTRDERDRGRQADRRQSYLDFLVALDAAMGRLREVADPATAHGDLRQEADRAVAESQVYRAREMFLMTANPAVAGSGERTLRSLGRLREAITKGAKTHTLEYHDVYHDYAGNLWQLRRAIRADLGAPELSPADLDKPGWDSRETCEFCRTAGAAASTAPHPV